MRKTKIWLVKLQSPKYLNDCWTEEVVAENFVDAGMKAMRHHKGRARYVSRVELVAENTI